MTGKQLRNSILQWAIQGKLVPQDPNDEPASVLLERIRAEKARLVKEKKIKRYKNETIIYRGEDNSYYEKTLATGAVCCIDDEIPFDIPQGWEWVRIQDIVQINPKNKADDKIIAGFIPMEKIEATYLSQFSYIERKWGEIKSGFTHFADGDVAVAKITPCFQNRKSMILQNLPNGIGAGTTELKVLRPYASTIVPQYLLFFLESAYFIEEATFKGTANQQRIISGYLETKLFPLPPVEEQFRITDKIMELMPICERFIKDQASLDKLNIEIWINLYKSILQEAIQGLLVPQIESEGTAEELLEEIRAEKKRLVKEGKLKKSAIANESRIFRGDDNKYYTINNGNMVEVDEIPFDIPNSWSWVRLGEIFDHNTGKALNGKGSGNLLRKYLTTSNLYWDYFDFSKIKEMYFSDSEIEKCTITKGDLLVCEGGDVGRAAIWSYDYDMCIQNHIHRLRAYFPICTRFFYYVLRYYKHIGLIGGKGIGIQGLSSKALHDIIIPLPTLAEQERISSHLDFVLASIMSR